MKDSTNKNILAEIYASDDMDNHPEQLKRIKSAQSKKTTPNSIDKDNQTGIFPGSGKNPYETTLHSCTCRDFVVRHLPCKHIYRLRMELGLLDKNFDIGINTNNEFSLESAVAELEKLNKESQLLIKNNLNAVIHRNQTEFPIKINTETEDLQSCSLLEIIDMPNLALHIFKRNQIIDILDKQNISGFKRNISLDNLIQWCCENISDIWSVFPKITVFRFSDKFQKAQHQTYKYLQRKYDWDSYYTEKENVNHMIEIRYPHGSVPEDLSFNISSNGKATSQGNPNIYHFPNDEITKLLTFYGHNRCLNGFDVTSQELE